VTDLNPRSLTWAEADPHRHAFELDEDAAGRLAQRVAPMLPGTEAARRDRLRSLDAVTGYLVRRYGRWACGWNWSKGESDIDGGVVDAWCCTGHSVTTADATAPLVVAALGEWHGWLSELAEWFEALAPPAAASSPVDPRPWERACAWLVTAVAERTEAQSGWYGHCMQVLGWYLTCHGFAEDQARRLVEATASGWFEIWTAPDELAVYAVSTRFATAVGRGT
jgi:hypothetical protein